MLLASGFVVLVGQGAGCCKVGLKHKAESEDNPGLLEVIDALDFGVVVIVVIPLVELGRGAMVVFGSNVRKTVVDTETPGGTAGRIGKTKEYCPDGNG